MPVPVSGKELGSNANMTEGATNLKEARNRPQTPQDFTLLKTIRYEEATKGVLPLPGSFLSSSKLPSTANSLEQANAQRPRSAPSPSPISQLPPILTEVKRDSGVAPSPSTIGYVQYAESNLSTSAAATAAEAGLPTIVVQDEAPGADGQSRSALPKGKSKDKQSTSESPTASKGIPRIESFKGIQSDISSSSLDGVDLADLASEKLAFSPRGSLLLGGEKMKDVKSQIDGAIPPTGIAEAPGTEDGQAAKEQGTTDTDQPQKSGLVAGRRKPSFHMLQAALHGGRVLSAEEMAFSLRVRTMYEHGDERGASSIAAGRNGSLGMRSFESVVTDNSTLEPSLDGIVVGKTKQMQTDEHRGVRSTTPNTQASYSRESNELAGGIEDWNDVEGQDVDRYGFINPKRISSRHSTVDQPPSEGVQRVATALRIESGKPRRNRKHRREPSFATRLSRPLTPSTNRDNTDRVTSLHSFQNDKSTTKRPAGNPFRSKDRRVLAEASDMLTLPPGIAESAEQEETGGTASMLKRRERTREDKWQSMAKMESQRKRSISKGGGMRFEFDTNDQKLISRTWKGIPDRWRATAWHSFLSTSAKKRGVGASDEELVLQFHKLQEEGSADDVQIDMDVPRTINLHIMFRRRYRGGQRLLFRLLHAISLYFPETGYVQGMASLAATLLCYFEEEQAFVMMVRLWQLRGLEQLFQSGFEGLMKALEEFERDWLKGGDVAKKLEELCVTSTAYGTRWYLTLFNLSIPFPAQLRVWDVFMLLGDASSKDDDRFGGADLDVLHAASAALTDAAREIILDSDFENAMKVLTSFVPVKDEDLFMRVAKAEWKLRKNRAAKT